ncbi:MAG: hypothetical protein ACFB00_12970 [Parvularculaceae bacterium]
MFKDVLKRLGAARLGLAAAAGFAAFGFAPAQADYKPRPPYCDIDHDHRAHEPRYYDYYPAARRDFNDGYRRAVVGDRRGYNGYAARRSRPRSKLVFRDVFAPRGRASVLVEERIVYGRKFDRRVCSVSARGPEARYVPYRRLERIANRNCSRRATVRIY